MNHSDNCSTAATDVAALLLPTEGTAASGSDGGLRRFTRADAAAILDGLPGAMLTALGRALADDPPARLVGVVCEYIQMARLIRRMAGDEATLHLALDEAACGIGNALAFSPVLGAVEAADSLEWCESTFNEYVAFGGHWYERGTRPTAMRGGRCGHDPHGRDEISEEEVPGTLTRPRTDFFALPEAEMKAAQAVTLMATLVHRTGSPITAFDPNTVALVADSLGHAPAIASTCLRLGRIDDEFLAEVITLARAIDG